MSSRLQRMGTIDQHLGRTLPELRDGRERISALHGFGNLRSEMQRYDGESRSQSQGETQLIKATTSRFHHLTIFQNLKVISISHQSDLCKLVVSVAEQCASLSRLESVRMNHEKSLSGTSSRAPVLSFSSKWRPQLHTLIWTCGAESLLCDEVLLERLRGARKVSISSYNLGLPWIVRLLARGSNLIDVRLRGNEKDAVENIPQMNLPYLEQLYLGKTPKSRSTGFKSLLPKSQDAKISHSQSRRNCS